MPGFSLRRALPIEEGEDGSAAKNRKLSQQASVYSGDAVEKLPDPGLARDTMRSTSDGADDRPELRHQEAARDSVAIAWGKGGPTRSSASTPPLSPVPSRPSTAVRGGAVGEDALRSKQPPLRGETATATGGSSGTPVAATVTTSAMAGDDDRGLTFEQIQQKYHLKIFNLILRFVGDREDAEDLTVETFVNAWRHWDRFRGEARIYTWLYQIAINNCKNRFKQRDRQREREPVSLDDSIETDSGELSREVADWRNAPEQLLMDKEFAARLRRAVDALRPEYKEVFILAEMEDMSYEDIARVTKLTVPAVKTRLHRARNMIRQRLEPYYRD